MQQTGITQHEILAELGTLHMIIAKQSQLIEEKNKTIASLTEKLSKAPGPEKREAED